MRLPIPGLKPRELTPSDRIWIALTVAVGIVGTCQGAAPRQTRASIAARAAASQRAHAPQPPPGRRDVRGP
jgi:hypothetical protein